VRRFAVVLLALAGCGQATGTRVPTIAHIPSAREPLRCSDAPHARARAHVELFLRGDIVVVPAGIGIRNGRRDGAYIHRGADGPRPHGAPGDARGAVRDVAPAAPASSRLAERPAVARAARAVAPG
jgi:hypothetical protein